MSIESMDVQSLHKEGQLFKYTSQFIQRPRNKYPKLNFKYYSPIKELPGEVVNPRTGIRKQAEYY